MWLLHLNTDSFSEFFVLIHAIVAQFNYGLQNKQRWIAFDFALI